MELILTDLIGETMIWWLLMNPIISVMVEGTP